MVQRKREYKATSKDVTNLALLNMDMMDGCPAPGPFVFDDFPPFDFLAGSNEQRKKKKKKKKKKTVHFLSNTK